MAQALQPWGVVALVKAMTHAQTTSRVKGAATKSPWNILDVSHAAYEQFYDIHMMFYTNSSLVRHIEQGAECITRQQCSRVCAKPSPHGRNTSIAAFSHTCHLACSASSKYQFAHQAQSFTTEMGSKNTWRLQL